MMIYMRHIRAANLCSGGARRWFESYGLSWSDFLTNGIPVATVEALNDGFGEKVIEAARKEYSDGR